MKQKTLLLLVCLLVASIAFPKTISSGGSKCDCSCKKGAAKSKTKLASAAGFDVFPFSWYVFMN